MRNLPKPTLIVVLVLVVIAGGLFTLLRSKQAAPAGLNLASFAEGGVLVDLSLEHGDQGQTILAARYLPQRDHFHVYSKDLPPDGVDGLGRPTRLEVVSGLQAAGDLSADMQTIDLKMDALNETLPVYPDGPVVLRLPIKVSGDGTGEVKLSYMACSESTCLPPTAKTVKITLPS